MRALVAQFFALLAATGAGAAVLSGPIANPANGHLYYLLDQASWTDSEAQAIALGGHLVTINDATENQWVFDTFTPLVSTSIPDCPCLWIGYNDVATEGSFVWVSGETPAHTNWNSGEPNNNGPENYAHRYGPTNERPGIWNDLTNAGPPDYP